MSDEIKTILIEQYEDNGIFYYNICGMKNTKDICGLDVLYS